MAVRETGLRWANEPKQMASAWATVERAKADAEIKSHATFSRMLNVGWPSGATATETLPVGALGLTVTPSDVICIWRKRSKISRPNKSLPTLETSHDSAPSIFACNEKLAGAPPSWRPAGNKSH